MDSLVNGHMDRVTSHDVDRTVTVLREQVDAICAQAIRAPNVLRLSAGSVSVHLEWWDTTPGTAPAELAPPVASAIPAPIAAPAPIPVAVPAPAPTPEPEPEPAAPITGYELCAQTVGVFYRALEPTAPPLVAEGDTVLAGKQVGVIEAMKLMTPIESDRSGRIIKILVANGASVEHGQPLMLLDLAS